MRYLPKECETALCLPEDQLRYVAFEGVCRLRLKRIDARPEAENLCKELGDYHRAPIEFFTVKTMGKFVFSLL